MDMCGRFTLYSAFDDIIDQFDIDQFFPKGEYQPSYNVAPSQNILAIINDGSNNRLGKLACGEKQKIVNKTIPTNALMIFFIFGPPQTRLQMRIIIIIRLNPSGLKEEIDS